MRDLFRAGTFVVCLLCCIWFLGDEVLVSAMETGYFMETNNGSSSEGYEDKAEIESPFHFIVEVSMTKEESLLRNSSDITNFTFDLYNKETGDLWASVKGSVNYTYSDGVSVTINEANAVVTTYWSSLGVETGEDYILNNYSEASYVADFYLIRRTTGVRVLYRLRFDVNCYGETDVSVYPIG